MASLPCPCGLSGAYETCCARFHRGDEPDRAETLMRSRYTAFVKRDMPYLFRTLHPEHPHKVQGERAFKADMKRHFALRIAYRKLVVLDTAAADPQGVSRVLFVAHLSERGRDLSFAELSLFAPEEGNLRYLAGHTMSLAELRGRTRIGEFAQ